MGKSLPSEADMGLAPSDDELSTPAAPSDDDIPLSDDIDTSPEPVKAAEPEAEAPKPAEKPADEPKMVDVRALQEARAEAREARRQAQVLEQRWNDYLVAQQAQNAPKPEPEVIPRADQNPVEALAWTQEQIIASQREAQERRRYEQEAQAQEDAYQQARAVVGRGLQEASAADPGINEAYSFIRESLGREAMLMGHTYESAKAEVDRLERVHIMHMAQTGQNPAEYIRGLAQTRGWQPKAAQPAPKPVDTQAVAEAQQRHMSLSDAGGGETPAPIDAKSLAKMTDKQFAAWMSRKGNADKFDEIMGR